MAAHASLAFLELLIHKHNTELHLPPPMSLDKQLVNSITQHLTYFQEFLHHYNSPPSNIVEDEEDPLVVRIENAADLAAKAICSHVREYIKSKYTASDVIIQSTSQCHDSLLSLVKVMDSIKKMVVVKVDTQKRKALAPVFHKQTVVGSDDDFNEIMKNLVGDQPDYQVIPIVGMGGIGKTFLANSIYADPRVKEHFDTRAWATISQRYSTKEILCQLLSQATCTEKEQLSEKSEVLLGGELHKSLSGRRFLIVLDDIWSMEAWDKIQRFIPRNENGSRVLVTTRLSHLCSQLNKDYYFQMSFLDESRSWDLFSKTVFGEKSCPLELKEIGEKIVDKCRGLPLSIVVVGGLLKKMDDTRASWESIRDNFTSVVSMDNDKHCLRLLKLSYNYLPVYLKPCFLYMGVFEEDKEIRVSMLVKLWVSEGFLKPKNGEALETTARGFLQDLIDRNLILISKMGPTGGIKYCKIHDLLRDVCLKQGQKYEFYHVIGKCDISSLDKNEHRRIVIHKNTSENNIPGRWIYQSFARSVICEDGEVPPFRFSGLLKTLHACSEFGPYNDESYVESLEFLHPNLQYLAIKVNGTYLSLRHFRLFWNLKTLIVSHSHASDQISIFVDDFWKMRQLRHIEFVGGLYLSDPPDFNERDGNAVFIMENLHTLKGVKNLKCSEGVVERIPNIKILKMKYLGLMGANNHDDDYCVKNIEHLCRLESLSIVISLVPLHNKLTFPHSLKKLSLLLDMEFEWEGTVLDNIASLPLLEELKVCGGSFGNGMLETVEGQFPSLKYLKLGWCGGLEHWTFEGCDILPCLEHLLLDCLDDLEIPCELGSIDTIKEIWLYNCGERAVKSAKEMFDEQVASQGEVSFNVVVNVRENQQHLQSLACPNFYVNL